MATTTKFEFLQVDGAYENNTLKSEYQQPGYIVFDKVTHTLTVCKSSNSAENTIYAGGLKTASFNERKLKIGDWDNNYVEVDLKNYATAAEVQSMLTTVLAGYATKTDITDALKPYATTESVNEKIEGVNNRIEKVEEWQENFASPEYTIERHDNADDGYSATYQLKKDGSYIGDKINIPKDMVVQSGEVVTNPSGQTAGTYIVLTLANATNDKLYIPVNALVDNYAGSTYITVEGGTISLNTDEAKKIFLPKEGGTVTGNLTIQAITTTQNIIPDINSANQNTGRTIGADGKAFKQVWAREFKGTADDALNAVNAINDSDGNNIVDTYATKAELTNVYYWKQLD